jgi:hypothetical protein
MRVRLSPSPTLRALLTALALASAFACGDEKPIGGRSDGAITDGADTDGAAGGDDGGDSGVQRPDVPMGFADALPADDATMPMDVGANANNPNNDRIDSDCDGLSDAYEFGTVYANGQRTSPTNPDTDGDGIPDGAEVGATTPVANSGCAMIAGVDADPTTRTNPTIVDTDGDGLPDGLEDTNRNGALEPTETNPLSRDTDGDGLLDGAEDRNQNGSVDAGETDPRVRDTDRDGIADGVEDANRNGAVDPGETSPTTTDSDGDGLADGVEDSNRNGTKDRTETDPRTPDTDCDGVADGEELMLMTSPLLVDSDGDGISDGVELGRTMPLAGTQCPTFVADGDPATTTNPNNPDTDGDGLNDGAEDTNRDGVRQPTETDPRVPDTDGDVIPDGDERAANTNPLDPNDPSPETRTGIAQVCLDGALKPIDFDVNQAGNWTIANETSTAYAAVTVGQAGVFAGALDDASQRFAGFVVAMPALPGGALDAAGQAAALAARLAANGPGQGVGVAQRTSPRNTTSHDGFPTAVSAVYEISANNRNTAEVRNALLAATTGLAPPSFTGLPTAIAPAMATNAYVAQWQILVRPADARVLVVLVVLDRTTFDSVASPAATFLADLTNGTAIARANARRSKACNPFVAGRAPVADFIWMADISGSTDDDRGRITAAAQLVFNALTTNGVDFRMGVVPHINNVFLGGGNAGLLRGVGFTRNQAQFISYMSDTSGNDGCEFGLSAVDAAINRALPRTPIGQPEEAQRLREAAQLAVIYVTDEFAQEVSDQAGCSYTLPCATNIGDVYSNGGNPACTAAPNQTCVDQIVAPYINRIRSNNGVAFAQAFSPTPRVACNAGQLVCPQAGSQAQNEPGIGYVEVVNAFGGVLYTPCTDNPGAALQQIVDAVSGAASQYQLTGQPISGSIKVGITRQGQSTTTIVPRDRQNGFDYDPVSNSIFFRGNTFRPALGDRVTVSYRVWLPPEDRCGGPCPPNQICDGALGVCVCDQGQCNASCGPNQVCDSNCQCTCGADCNGQCGGNQRCNQATCQCECPGDCGGCPSGTQCNPGTCACECTDCGGACGATPNLECNQAACACQCPADCGGRCAAGTTCNTSTCECTCPADCDANCPGQARCDVANGCGCACPADCGGCPDGTICNLGGCSCECPADPPCSGLQVKDPNNRCACTCPTNCGGACGAGERCDAASCRCVPGV